MPWRLRSSRTSLETRLSRQETPYHEHGVVVLVFQLERELEVSAEDLKASKGCASGWLKAAEIWWRWRRGGW